MRTELKKSKFIYLSLLSGILLGLSFPPIPLNLLAFIGLVPILYIVEMNPKRTFIYVYITFSIYHALTNWWISSWQPDSDPYLLYSGIAVWLVHPIFFLLPFIFYKIIKKRISSTLALYLFPLLWIIFEWFRTLGDLAYPWLTLGYTQAYNIYWIQFADITGVWGISFMIVMINVLILKIILFIKESEIDPRKMNLLIKQKPFFKMIAIVIFLFLIPYLYGFIIYPTFDYKENITKNKSIKIGLIQPNINPWRKWEVSALSQIEIHKHIQDSLVNSTGGIDLAIWNETAITYQNLELNSEHDFSFLKNWLDLHNVSLLSGFSDIQFLKLGQIPSATTKPLFGDTSKMYNSYNSTVLINPTIWDSSKPKIYHKMKLTPFGERIPYVDLFSFTLKWLEWNVGISSWSKGEEHFNLTYNKDGFKTDIGTIICIESVFPAFVAENVNMGASILAIITNDAWYDHTFGPEQHYCIAVFRAIETRRFIARCANTGISGFIAANGKTILKADHYQRTAIAASMPLLDFKGIYVRFGDWIIYLSIIIVIVSIFVKIFRKKKIA